MAYQNNDYHTQQVNQQELAIYRSFYFQMNEILNRYNTNEFPENFIEEVKLLNRNIMKFREEL